MSNDKILVESFFGKFQEERYPNQDESVAFEMFVTEQVLKDYKLNADDFEYGLTGRSNDGGVDGFYTFINNELIYEDTDIGNRKGNVIIDVYVFQTKHSDSFREVVIDKFIVLADNLFNLSEEIFSNKNKQRYNDELLSNIDIFRQAYLELSTLKPELNFHYYYATLGDAGAIHANIKHKSNDLETKIQKLFTNAKFDFKFLGALELLLLKRQQPNNTIKMRFAESLTGTNGYVVLVSLIEFAKFLQDQGSNNIRSTIFEHNVRDFQGEKNIVNKEIRDRLDSDLSNDFWWFNNGVTIVAKDSHPSGKELVITDPLIVNGLQTSYAIFEYSKNGIKPDDTRCVLVRVINVTNQETSDGIIKATNSQTSISPASLRATDKIQRDIEEFLEPKSIYYDRRKNSQKLANKPAEDIISIVSLAQIVMSILLQKPNQARARPSTVLSNNDDYKAIFSEKFDLEIYYISIRIYKTARSFLSKVKGIEKNEQTNLIYYICMVVACYVTKSTAPNDKQLLNNKKLIENNDLYKKSYNIVYQLYKKLGGNEKVSKGNELLGQIQEELKKIQF